MLKYMTDKEQDTNELLIREFIEYSKWATRFELFGYKESAKKARNSLMQISKLARQRYREIQAKKTEMYGNQNDQVNEVNDDN
jgi:hypothetical protein